MKVYLSGPISDLTFADAAGWRSRVVQRLGSWNTLDPLRGKSFLSNQRRIHREEYEAEKNPALSDEAIVGRDMADVSASDIVLINLLGATAVSIGTMQEQGQARAERKRVVLVMEDSGNIHDHPFVRQGAVRFNDLDVALDYIISCFPDIGGPRVWTAAQNTVVVE